MAQYEHLPLFKNAYDFKLYFVKLSRGFPKDFKYGIAIEIRELCLKVIDNIILANNSRDKTEYLQNILIEIERIKIKVRILNDLKVIKLTSYKHISEQLVEISKQTAAWKSWSAKEH
ncbi:MAG: four helix bundle protein [bacterium]